MKTKFILHGGFTKGKTEKNNREFYTEILKDAPEGAKILLVCFAKDDEHVPIATERVKVEFNKNKWQKEITFEVASDGLFIEQIKVADVIYFHGGTTLKLLEALKKFPNLKDSLSGKIVAGESAGANVFGKFFYSPSANKVDEGLGFLPLKIIPHYSEEYKGKLDNVGQDLESLLLPEYEYKVFEIIMDKSKFKIEKVVYFVRHGQSADNVAPVFQSPDSPLNERGKRQAESIAQRVSKLSFDALIASPFERAKQTAEAIARVTDKKAVYSELFVGRVKPTYINGKPYTDEKANGLWREWQKSLYMPGMRAEDGENFDDLVARADKALAFLQNRPEQSLVVVTHGYFLQTIVARVLLGELLSGEIFRNIQRTAAMENTGMTVLQYRERFEEKPAWRLWIYNDHAHLAD